ncbi:DNA topoisomerase IB [Algimonas porphyrae]|uniref:DNA topoisomerase n=1 Tax=Algimonas porphyrae TaxID=1128113 RepID=A0ABQ5V3J5_9PROT|nr:hypothetical protein [Algimonas porphyrae]GLQ21156.1 DNA topoisomerase [Algimonas porphyrae]
MAALPHMLRYSSQDEPGLTRVRRGRGFSYHDAEGNRIADPDILTRIRSLGLPPAYKDVWICADAQGHLQAAGTDARGRRQYRYHTEWRAFRDARKFEQLDPFGRKLPRLRERVDQDLRRNRPDRDQVCAALVRLIDRTALRVGSERYARDNSTYGATTLRSRHLQLEKDRLRLSFTAKGRERVRKQMKDQTLARVIERLDDLPGARIFSYLGDDGSCQPVLSDDVNRYIAEATGESGMTAKTFRTWHGTLAALEKAVTTTDGLTIKNLSEAAAQRLHNSPAIARSSYIHPAVIALTEMDDAERKARLDGLDLRRAPNRSPTQEKRLLSLLSQGSECEG